MLHPPFRAPREKVAGLYHIARMLDKIRCHLQGELPEEYRRNYGLSIGLDGNLCGFLGVDFKDVEQRCREGMTDEQVAEWCFSHGLRPSATQTRIWNGFAEKMGWRDRAAAFVAKTKVEDGRGDRTDLVTSFDLIDFREGRMPAPPAPVSAPGSGQG